MMLRDEADEMLRLALAGESARTIARKYGCHRSRVAQIVRALDPEAFRKGGRKRMLAKYPPPETGVLSADKEE